MIKDLAELGKDKKKLEEIGSQIVREAIRNAAGQKLGLKDESPDVIRIVRQNEKVPSDLLRDVTLRDGVAEAGWEKTWTNLGLWERNWAQNETDRIINPGRFPDLKAGLRAKVVFNPDELKIIEEMKILQR